MAMTQLRTLMNRIYHSQLVNIRVNNVNFGQCLIFVYLGLQKHTNAIVKAKMGEDGVLAEYLPKLLHPSLKFKIA